jgi:hypothetical protein
MRERRPVRQASTPRFLGFGDDAAVQAERASPAYTADWPTSFWITTLSGMVCFGGTAVRRFAG